MKAALIGLFATLIASNALADSLVRCVTTSKNPAPVLEYFIRSAPSQRLNSDITYTSGSSSRFISSDAVAQYKTSNIELYLLTDANSAGDLDLRLVALGLNGKNYVGAVTQYDANNKAVKNIAVKCSVSAF